MKKKDKYIVIFIVAFSSFLILFLIYKTINELKYRKGKPEEIIYTSNINSDTKYLVYLKNNPFIDKEYLSSDLSYITSLVDSIDLKYNYQYDNDKILNLNYQYWIEARIISEYISESTQNLKNPIWDKSFNLTDVINGDTSTGKVDFELGSTINFEYYSNMVKEFTNNLSIGTNSRLEISLIVKINNDSFNKQYKTTMQIPLGVKAFDINIYKDFSEQEIVYNKEQKEEVSYVTAIMYIILIIIIAFIGYYLIKKVINCQKNKCLLRVKKILKEYDD